MNLPELQFLNLPQIDAAIQQRKANEVQNALAPYLMQKTQMDVERGGLEMQQMRDAMEQQKQIRAALASQYADPARQQSESSQAATDYRSRQAAMLRKQADVYMRFGNVDAANKLQEQAIKLEPEFSQTPQYDQQGNAFVMDKQGNPKYLDGVKARDKIVSDDLGGQRTYRTEYSAVPIATANKTQTQDSIASVAAQIRGQDLTNARGVEANALKAQEIAAGGKPPPGYRWNGNVLEAIPGGPGDKLPESQQKQVVGVNNLSNAISEYRSALDKFSALDTLNPNTRATMGTAYNNMMLQAKEAYNLGVLNGPDFQILQSVVTDPRSVTGAFTSKTALDKQASELDRIMQGVGAVSSKPRQPQQSANRSQDRIETDSMPNPAQHVGKTATDQVTGVKYKSDGKNWVRVP